jgi:hypothetical protein
MQEWHSVRETLSEDIRPGIMLNKKPRKDERRKIVSGKPQNAKHK